MIYDSPKPLKFLQILEFIVVDRARLVPVAVRLLPTLAPRRLMLVCALTGAAIVSVGHAANDVAPGVGEATGPNGEVRFDLLRGSDGHLQFRVSFKKTDVIESSPIRITLDGTAIAEGVTVGRAERYRQNETYPWRGVHATAVNRFNGARFPITHTASKTAYTLDVRAFNDGIAFRYLIPGPPDASRVPDETTGFTIPDGSTVWFHDFEGHYEGTHAKKAIADVKEGEWAAPPLTIKLPDGRGYASITEGALYRYSGLGLQANGRRGFEARLGHAQPLNYPFRLRYGVEEGARLAKPATINGPITSPWRIVLVGGDLNTLVNGDIVHNVSPPPDKTLFPKGFQEEWLKPGRSVWRYLDGGENTFEGIKEFSRMAGELGFEYNLLEGFWQKWTDEQLREMVAYSAKQGVGLIVWKHSRDLRKPEERLAFFKRCQDLGFVGVKLDFFDHEAKEVVELYEVMLREAAQHKLIVNFHGANKPTGESRTWPNELTREGIWGMERSKTPAWATHNATLPFTRYLAGPADYTGVVLGERRRETSWAHQIATHAVFTSPLLVYGGNPKSLLENPAVEMIKSIPAVWDETRVLPMSEIGEIAAFARRRGNTWFLAVVNGPTARTVTIPLTFLGASAGTGGERQALMVSDRADDPAAVDVKRSTANAKTSLSIELRAGGGFIARFADTASSSR
jgi:alpha-glucosidase